MSKYEDGQKKQHWQKNFKFSKRNPYVSNDEDLDLLSENLCFCVFDVTPHESDVLIPNSCPGSRDSFCQRPDETGRQVTVRCAVP